MLNYQRVVSLQFFNWTCRILPYSSVTGLVQVDDRATENLWIRMVQTPFPYGGGLIPTEVSLGVTATWPFVTCESWHVMTCHDMWIAQFAIVIAVCPLKVPVGQATSILGIPFGWSSHLWQTCACLTSPDQKQNPQELKQQERHRET